MGRLACDATLSTRIAAFAPVSGAYYIDALTTDAECADPAAVDIPCDAGRPGIPIMAFHGGADPTIDYEGGLRTYCLPAVRHWAEAWVDRNGLNVSEVDNSTIAGSDNGVVSSWGGGLVKLVYDGDDIEHDVSHSNEVVFFSSCAWRVRLQVPLLRRIPSTRKSSVIQNRLILTRLMINAWNH